MWYVEYEYRNTHMEIVQKLPHAISCVNSILRRMNILSVVAAAKFIRHRQFSISISVEIKFDLLFSMHQNNKYTMLGVLGLE